jgi:hypothetical protein
MDDEILERIGRIYAAIGAIQEHDPSKLKATVIQTEKSVAVCEDFRAGLTDEELSNQAHSVIHNIANLRDHLRRWVKKNSQDKQKVDQAVSKSFQLQLIEDFSNNDKHGYPPRDEGCSGRCPQLVDINRVMRLQTRAKKGSMGGMVLGPRGAPRFIGDGTAKAVVTGDVVDKDGNCIGDLYDIASKAVEAWERLLADFQLTRSANGS